MYNCIVRPFSLQLKCRQEKLIECFDPARVETIIHNFLVGEFKKALNVTDVLGEQVSINTYTLDFITLLTYYTYSMYCI